MEKIVEKLIKSKNPLISKVNVDEFILLTEKNFDCIYNGESKFFPWEKPKSMPDSFGLGVIVGASGSGKSTLLKEFGIEEKPIWDDSKSVISHFGSPEDGINRLTSVGFNTIPSWYKPYSVLSNGEKFRADLARKIKNNCVIDEYTSVVDRNVAKAASVSLSKFIKREGFKNIVLSSCHYDILDWLEPDWVINTDTGEFYNGFFLSDQKSKLIFTGQEMMFGECLKTIII